MVVTGVSVRHDADQMRRPLPGTQFRHSRRLRGAGALQANQAVVDPSQDARPVKKRRKFRSRSNTQVTRSGKASSTQVPAWTRSSPTSPPWCASRCAPANASPPRGANTLQRPRGRLPAGSHSPLSPQSPRSAHWYCRRPAPASRMHRSPAGFQAVPLQTVVHHRHVAMPHPAGADRVVDGLGPRAQVVGIDQRACGRVRALEPGMAAA